MRCGGRARRAKAQGVQRASARRFLELFFGRARCSGKFVAVECVEIHTALTAVHGLSVLNLVRPRRSSAWLYLVLPDGHDGPARESCLS